MHSNSILAPLAGPLEGVGLHPAASQHRVPVIVVDDDRDTAESFATLLRLHGYDAREVSDPAAAVATAAAMRTRAALIDIQMPGLNGLELARRFRRDALLASTLLIAVSGWARRFDRQRARAAGFDAHLTKPVDLGKLLQLLAPVAAGHPRVRPPLV
jgi:CheY-like chemotaxis protein